MDVNISNETKIYSAPIAPAVETEDKVKPQVSPVEKSSESVAFSLNEQALHSKKREEQGQNRLSREDIEKAVDVIQKRLESIGSNLTMGFDQDKNTEDIVTQIRDRNSNEVIRQIPSDEILQLRAKLDDLVGILYDKSV